MANMDMTDPKIFQNITEPTTYRASYIEMSYTVNWKNWDGVILKTEIVPAYTEAAPPNDPTKKGCDFLGWDAAYNEISDNTDITATFSASKLLTVTWKAADGSVIRKDEIEAGDPVTPPTPPDVPNKIFDKWDQDYSNITQSMDITAVYREAKEFTLAYHTYDYDGNYYTIKTEKVKEGCDGTPPAPGTFQITYGKEIIEPCWDESKYKNVTKSTYLYANIEYQDKLFIGQVTNRDGTLNTSNGVVTYPRPEVYAAIRPNADIFTNYTWITPVKKAIPVDCTKASVTIGDPSMAKWQVDGNEIRLEALKEGSTTITVDYEGETITIPLHVVKAVMIMSSDTKDYSSATPNLPKRGEVLVVPAMTSTWACPVCIDYDLNGDVYDYKIPLFNYEYNTTNLLAKGYKGYHEEEYGNFKSSSSTDDKVDWLSSPIQFTDTITVNGNTFTNGSYNNDNVISMLIDDAFVECRPAVLGFIETTASISGTVNGVPCTPIQYKFTRYDKDNYIYGYSCDSLKSLTVSKSAATRVPFPLSIKHTDSSNVRTTLSLDRLPADFTLIGYTSVFKFEGKRASALGSSSPYYKFPRTDCLARYWNTDNVVVYPTDKAVPGTYIYGAVAMIRSGTRTETLSGDGIEVPLFFKVTITN